MTYTETPRLTVWQCAKCFQRFRGPVSVTGFEKCPGCGSQSYYRLVARTRNQGESDE